MIVGIIGFILAILGILGYYNDILVLLYIGGIFTIVESIFGFITGQSRGFFPEILFGIIGMIFVKPLLQGFMFGLCIENVVMFIFGSILMVIAYKKGKQLSGK